MTKRDEQSPYEPHRSLRPYEVYQAGISNGSPRSEPSSATRTGEVLETRRIVTLTFTRAEIVHRALACVALGVLIASPDVRPGTLGSSLVAVAFLYGLVTIARDVAGFLARRLGRR